MVSNTVLIKLFAFALVDSTYDFSTYSFPIMFTFLIHNSQSQVINLWTDALDTTNGGNNINWTTGTSSTGSITAPFTTASNCPNDVYCWELQENYYAYYTHSTLLYDNITLTVSISALSLETSDACAIYYSKDQSTNWITPALISWTNADTFPKLSVIITLPTDAANNAGIGIKIQSENNAPNKLDYCYFSDITLKGNLITTTQPTTTNPTTAIPTTALPTTIAPTTTNPTTTAPTANPTTSQPTAPTAPTMPTTTTTTRGTSRTQDEDESNSGSSSGNTGEILVYVAIVFGVLLLIGCVVCIVYKSKSKKHKESNETMENEIAAQYMDAYAGGGKVSKPVQPPNTGNIDGNDGNTQYDNRNQYGGYDGQYNQNQNENENKMTTEQQVVTNDANSGPAPPVELTQIFGPTQNERVSANRKDSDEDSIMKKQTYFSEHESDD